MKFVRIILSMFVAVAVAATQAQAAGGAGGGGAGGGGGAAGGGGGAPGGGGAGGGGGGGGGGGVTAPPVTNPLPQAPPEAGITFRESFGFGIDPAFERPQGGKLALRAIFAGTGLSQFWVEYPGSTKSLWAAQNWNFGGGSDNPFEIASPIQTLFNGVAVSDWRDGILRTGDLVAPFAPPGTKYSVSAEILPPGLPGSYVGFGLTTSGATLSNLPANGQIWVRFIADQPFGITGTYQVLSGSAVLASGSLLFFTFTPVAITVDPSASTATVSIQGLPVGTWATKISSKFLAFEGQGVADDVIVRTVP